LHEKMARDLWASALKGPAAVRFMRSMMEKFSSAAASDAGADGDATRGRSGRD
jgi:hypothetical protein